MAISAAPDDYAGLFHALRATSMARPVPRSRPPLCAPPGTAATPWLFWYLGGLLALREPWIERLGHALSLGMWGAVLGGLSCVMLSEVRHLPLFSRWWSWAHPYLGGWPHPWCSGSSPTWRKATPLARPVRAAARPRSAPPDPPAAP
jgi:hypothetical protein